MKVRVKKCSNTDYWHVDRIGDVFKVIGVDRGDYKVIVEGHHGPTNWILTTDCEVVGEEDKPDMVGKPPHYTNRKMEVIDMMVLVYGYDAAINFCDLNAFKYRMRAGYKGDVKEDIDKAIWYENKSKELDKEKSE